MSSPEDIVELLDKFKATIEAWPTGGGLFVDLMGEKLQQIKQKFVQDVATQLPNDTFNKTNPVDKIKADQTEVYVALYQMDGDNLARWVMTLNTLAIQGTSRPIYQNEADVCAMIRGKQQKLREAYVVVKVPTANIIKTNHPSVDSAGNILLHLKPGSLKPEYIQKFVHYSGQYLWQNNQLIKLDLMSPIREKF